MTLTEEVKTRVLAEDMDLVGITPVERLAGAPVGRRPTDILPTAKNVIVAAVHVLDSVYDLPYTRYEYTNQFFILNSRLNAMATELCQFLEEQGYRIESITGCSSSRKIFKRRRKLKRCESRCTTTAKRDG